MVNELKDKVKSIIKREPKKEIPLRILEEQEEKRKKMISDTIFAIALILVLCALLGATINNVVIDVKLQQYANKVQSTINSGPIQIMLEEPDVINFKGVKITKLATYDITAKVFGMEFFHFGGGANTISPQDLALKWGPAASDKYNNDIEYRYSTNDRMGWFYFNGPYYQQYKGMSSIYVSNNHIIPMNNQVKSELKKVRVGDYIELLGWLVDCQGNNWHWGPSSLVRDDDGNGACEIILVEYLSIIK